MSLDQIKSILNKPENKQYLQFEKLLGEGLDGVVAKCRNLQDGSLISLKLLKDATDEINIISSLPSHQNIPKFINQINCNEGNCLLQEYSHGQDLFSLMEQEECLYEIKARKILTQLLNAIKHLHGHSIVHRDIKLENIIIDANDGLKLIDFGLSVRITNDTSLNEDSGSESYFSPEILDKEVGYGRPVDLWACGVVLYVLLSGTFPFWHEDSKSLFNMIRNCEWEFEEEDWKFISYEAKDLISKLLTRDPNKRLTAEDALQHLWITKH